MSKKARGNLLLVFTAAIWGTAFVAQKDGMSHLQPFTFNGVRMLLAGLALLPVAVIVGRRQGAAGGPETVAARKKATLWGGIACGVVLFVASGFQQFAVLHTTAGKAAFITTLYIVLVPILGLLLHKRAGAKTWLSVAIAVCGLWLLSIQGDFSMARGDILATVGAFWFAVHILVIDHFSPRANALMMSCIQFLVCGGLGIVASALFETPSPGAILAAWLPIIYSGVVSSGVGFTLQILAQRDTDPTVASLIMSLESVFAVVAGWLVLHETLTAREALGCALMLGAIVLSQVRVGAGQKSEDSGPGA